MIKTVSILHEELKNYSNIKSKIQSLCSRGDLYPLVRNDAFGGLDPDKLFELAGHYRCTNHRILRSLIRKDVSDT